MMWILCTVAIALAAQEPMLMPRAPEWQVEVTGTYENGLPREVQFYNDEKETVKRVRMYETGARAWEEDLQNGVLHGAAIGFFPSGAVSEIVTYEKGMKEGQHRLFYEDGKIRQEGTYKKDVYEGDVLGYYPDGKRRSVVTYVNGLKEGEVREWYNNGVLRIKVHYEHGREQDVGENPALIAYDETGAIFSTRYFNEGKPHGLHVMYHPNGREAERVSYDDAGKMDGLLETFSDDGTLIGESVFEHGRPIGKAWRNYPSGAAKLRADYTQEIALVEEFAENGQCVARYHVQDERYVGPFQQWTPEGVLMVDFLYEEGSVTGREYYPDGSIKAIKEKSTLELYYPNGQLKEKVLFTEGKFDGAALGFFENGEPAFERMYAAGQFIGEQREYYPGKRLARSVTYDKLGKVHGVEKSYYPSGKLRAEVVYDHGILHGKKGHYREDGVVLEEGFYKKGKLEGIYQCRDPAGMLTRISYVNNKKEGAFTIFYPDGKTKALEATYHKGCLEGELKEYTQEGELISVIPYKHGKKEGMAKGFIQGVIATSALFTQDLREGEMIQYYPNGQVKKITPFKNDKREGEEIAYHKNGTIEQRNVYKEDRLDGVSQAWNEKGTLIFEADYVAGKREGRFNKYNDDGVLRLRQTFKGDELVSKEAVVMR